VIFVTVGNDLPFSRLVEQADIWSKHHPGERVFAQTGSLRPSDHVPQSMEWAERLIAQQFEQRCGEAKLIVAHAGMGSIITALAAGTPIVILPRLARLKEHRNDHQLATAKRFADRPGIFVAWTEADLGTAIERALAAPEASSADRLPQFAPPEFTDRLRAFILHGRRPSR
jgi:UDP-N-acetylglucosamine transferase subunit ALG13